MTNFTKTLMLAAAACTIAAGSAAAQTYQAEIPFTFRAGSATLAPGRYAITVSHLTVGKFLVVREMDTHKSICCSRVARPVSGKARMARWTPSSASSAPPAAAR